MRCSTTLPSSIVANLGFYRFSFVWNLAFRCACRLDIHAWLYVGHRISLVPMCLNTRCQEAFCMFCIWNWLGSGHHFVWNEQVTLLLGCKIFCCALFVLCLVGLSAQSLWLAMLHSDLMYLPLLIVAMIGLSSIDYQDSSGRGWHFIHRCSLHAFLWFMDVLAKGSSLEAFFNPAETLTGLGDSLTFCQAKCTR